MKNNQGNLLLLLRFMDDCLTEQEVARARKLLTDPVGQSRWQLLQQASRRDPLIDGESADEAVVSADSMAAFVEQKLPADEALRIESACWQSLPALCEVISTFRFIQRNRSRAVTPELTRRLLGVLPPGHDDKRIEPSLNSHDHARFEPANGRLSPGPPQSTSIPDFTANDRGKVEIPTPNVSHAARHRIPPGLAWWACVVAVLIVVVGIGGLVVIWSGGEEDRTAAPNEEEQVTPREDNPSNLKPRFADSDRQIEPGPPDPHESAPTAEEDDEVIVTDGHNLMKELDLPADWKWPEDWLIREEDVIEPLVNEQVVPTREPVAVAWDRIEGILAAWDEGSKKWQGINYQIGKINSTFATLTSSWASTVPNAFGHMVLASDTEIHFGQNTGETMAMDVSVIRGRLALHDLPVEKEITVRVGASRWKVRAARPESIVAVDLTSADPRVFVSDGEVLVDDNPVRTKQQIAWADGRWDVPRPLGRRENTSWTNRPVHVARLSANVQTLLLSSNDMRQELKTVSGLDARLATQWALAIAPQDTFEQMNSPDAKVRLEAIKWLLSLHPGDRRVTMALRQLLAAAHNPQLVRSMSNWIQAMRQNRAPKIADAQQLVRGLEHPELAIRQFSAFLLEAAFPQQRNAFRPEASPQARQASAEQWRRFLQTRISRAARQAAARRGATATGKNAARPPRPKNDRVEQRGRRQE